MSTPPLADARVRQIALSVSDVARARVFYEETLGLPLLFEADGMAFLSLGGLRLMLGPGEPCDRAGAVIIYFDVPNIEERWAALEAAGVERVEPPHKAHEGPDKELWLAFFKDPDGHMLALMEEKPKR